MNRVLYGLVVLSHDQLVEAFPRDTAPDDMLQDCDRARAYGLEVPRQLKIFGTDGIVPEPRSPWPNAFVEHAIGSLRRQLFDHVLVLGEDHARRLLRESQPYYTGLRTHLSLGKEAPNGREVEQQERGVVVALPVLGGLHHRYT